MCTSTWGGPCTASCLAEPSQLHIMAHFGEFEPIDLRIKLIKCTRILIEIFIYLKHTGE